MANIEFSNAAALRRSTEAQQKAIVHYAEVPNNDYVGVGIHPDDPEDEVRVVIVPRIGAQQLVRLNYNGKERKVA